MMIAIVILGLGLLMVATMFPVAWDRARTLSEHTIEQSVVPGAEVILESVLRPASARMTPIDSASNGPPFEVMRIASGSLAGDLIYDPKLAEQLMGNAATLAEAYHGIVLYSDTRVHALNLPNIKLSDGTVVPEDPWRLEYPDPSSDRFNIRGYPTGPHPAGAGYQVYQTRDFATRTSFYFLQVDLGQRLYPPHEPRPDDSTDPEYDAKLGRWNERLSTRRFCWAALHRLRESVGPPCESQESPGCLMPNIVNLCGPRDPGPPPPPPLAPDARESQCLAKLAEESVGSTRNFDAYYVTLRKPQPTHRYARQNPAPQFLPNPFVLDPAGVSVEPLGADDDVALPVAWRVQVQLPPTLAFRAKGTNAALGGQPPTGIPTEIQVPHPNVTGDAAAMIVSMFPTGAMFVDEISGLVYRVTKRRIIDRVGQSAVLTLDREIVLEDIDLPQDDPRCDCHPIDPLDPQADDEELRRTVWVFPPPVDRSLGGSSVIFDGPSPVVGIEVRTLSLSPPS